MVQEEWRGRLEEMVFFISLFTERSTSLLLCFYISGSSFKHNEEREHYSAQEYICLSTDLI